MRHRLRAALAIGVLSLTATGCPQPNDAACGSPPDHLFSRISDEILAAAEEESELRNPRTYAVDGSDWTFLSIEHRTPKEVDDDDRGDILTFAVDTNDDTRILAVDELARKESTFEVAEFDVREEGAIESRGCVYSASHEGEPRGDR